jgi:hypothetical protein
VSLLTLYGLLAVSAMLVFYALEHRSHHFVLAFAIACVLASMYGFLQGAWPFGLVELVWSGVALRRWWEQRTSSRRPATPAGGDAQHPLETARLPTRRRWL